jgi:cardiolipin synthase
VDHLVLGVIFAGAAFLSLASVGHALLFKRDPRSALGWIMACLVLPLLGPVLYWSMGVNRIRTRARQWLESGRRLAGWDTLSGPRAPEDRPALQPGSEYLTELCNLTDRLVGSPLVAGNRMLVLHNGEEAYPAMLAAIAGARRSINLSTYIFDGDGSGRRFVDALRAAAGRGVDVRVIVDSLGEKYSHPSARKVLRGSPVRVGRFLPLRQGGYVNLRNHRKILVVDGATAFTGGMNIGDRHLVERSGPPPAVTDVHFRVEGPVVAELQKVFLEDWYFVTGELVEDAAFFPPIAPAGASLARTVADGPDREYRTLNLVILGALACARRRVLIMTPYFIPDRPLLSAITTTALRGVEVTLILPARNNLPFVHWATRSYLWELLQLGVRVMYQPPPFVHTKLFLVDGTWSLIGSANLDPRSLRLNFELDLEVYDREFTNLLERDMAQTIARSREVTLAEMDGRPLPEKVRDATAKLFSPYL